MSEINVVASDALIKEIMDALDIPFQHCTRIIIDLLPTHLVTIYAEFVGGRRVLDIEWDRRVSDAKIVWKDDE